MVSVAVLHAEPIQHKTHCFARSTITASTQLGQKILEENSHPNTVTHNSRRIVSTSEAQNKESAQVASLKRIYEDIAIHVAHLKEVSKSFDAALKELADLLTPYIEDLKDQYQGKEGIDLEKFDCFPLDLMDFRSIECPLNAIIDASNTVAQIAERIIAKNAIDKRDQDEFKKQTDAAKKEGQAIKETLECAIPDEALGPYIPQLTAALATQNSLFNAMQIAISA